MFSEIAEESHMHKYFCQDRCLGMHPGKNNCTYVVFFYNLNSTSSGCLHMSIFYQ